MAETNKPLYANLPGTYRLADIGRPWGDRIREGVMALTHMAVTQRAAGANMSVDVAAGTCWVQGDDGTDPPKYRCHAPAIINLAVLAADAEPRIDLVVAQVYDSQFLGSSDAWERRIIKGTPSASPVVPALPNGAIDLARVAVAAGATSITNPDVTDRRQPATVTPHAVVKRVATQTIGTSTTAAVLLDTQIEDTWNLWPPAYTPAIVVPVTGIYSIKAQVIWEFHATGLRTLTVKKSQAGASSQLLKEVEAKADATTATYQDVDATTTIDRNGYVELTGFQSSGGNLVLTASLAVTMVGA